MKVWEGIFDYWGSKVVTKTDKDKSAYVVSKKQLRAIEASGLMPSGFRPAEPFNLTLLFDRERSVVATFYNAQREDPDRRPEPRIGRAFITEWLSKGELVVIGNIGSQLFALKDTSDESAVLSNVAQVIASASEEDTKKRIIAKALEAGVHRPSRVVVQRNDFVRSPAIVLGAIARAEGRCEMPGCCTELFNRDDGTVYLEVHHVVPLAEGGEDSLINASALCPRCHRELHFGMNRHGLRARLRSSILERTR